MLLQLDLLSLALSPVLFYLGSALCIALLSQSRFFRADKL